MLTICQYSQKHSKIRLRSGKAKQYEKRGKFPAGIDDFLGTLVQKRLEEYNTLTSILQGGGD